MEEKENKKQKGKTSWWKSYTRRQKVFFFIGLGISVFSILILLMLFFARELGAREAADTLFGEGKNGWMWLGDMLANSAVRWFMTLFVLGVGVTVNFLLSLLVSLITWKGKRSRTVGSLIKSLFHYAFWIVVIGMILSVWGVDIASIVAGLGIVTLIIGLGCQSLIADIVAGVFIVFDDFFDVDDIVVIDSFRGTIKEIGLRSTKMVDWAGNIKAINNSEVKSVVNLSRLASGILLDFTIDKEEDLEKAESLFAKALPDISHSLPKVIGEITYKGTNGLEENGITMTFFASCQEEDRFQVIRDIKRELYLLMKRNGIEVPFKKMHIVNEKEKERETASEEEKEIASKLNEANRAAPKED